MQVDNDVIQIDRSYLNSISGVSQASSAATGLISPILYYFTQGFSATSGSYSPVGAGGSLVPGKGYWVYAYKPTTLTFSLPSTAVAH